MASERRWWKITRTPGQALGMGVGWTAGGIAELVAVLGFGANLLQLIAALLFLVFGAFYLSCYAMMRRHGWKAAG